MSKNESLILSLEYEYPRIGVRANPKRKLYHEDTEIFKKEYTLNKTLSLNGQVNQIINDMMALGHKSETIQKNFLMLKLFRYIARKDNQFNQSILNFDKYINKFKVDFNIVNTFFNSIRNKKDITEAELDDLYTQINNLFIFAEGLLTDIAAFKKKYYKEFKVSSYALVKDKSVNQMEEFVIKVNEEINEYKSLEEANDYITYHSGDDIIKVVNGFVKMKKKDNNFFDYYYFLDSDAIIDFKYSDWFELFMKFRYVMSKLKGSVLYTSEFKKNYLLLEVKYAIISIYNEM